MLSAGLEAFAKATLATGAFMSTVPKSTGATDGEKATLDTVGDVPEGLALIDGSRAFLVTIIGEECKRSGMSSMTSGMDKKGDTKGGVCCPVGSIIP
jgi:hypothetical protein